MVDRRRNDIEAFLVNLAKNDRADLIDIDNTPDIAAEIAESENPNALPSLPFAILGKQRIHYDSRCGGRIPGWVTARSAATTSSATSPVSAPSAGPRSHPMMPDGRLRNPHNRRMESRTCRGIAERERGTSGRNEFHGVKKCRRLGSGIGRSTT